jgi:hypothetical protein
MATPRKKPVKKPITKVITVKDEDLTPLDIHAIQIHELYKAFRKAGFPVDMCLALISDPSAHPAWFFVDDLGLEVVDDEDLED